MANTNTEDLSWKKCELGNLNDLGRLDTLRCIYKNLFNITPHSLNTMKKNYAMKHKKCQTEDGVPCIFNPYFYEDKAKLLQKQKKKLAYIAKHKSSDPNMKIMNLKPNTTKLYTPSWCSIKTNLLKYNEPLYQRSYQSNHDHLDVLSYDNYTTQAKDKKNKIKSILVYDKKNTSVIKKEKHIKIQDDSVRSC